MSASVPDPAPEADGRRDSARNAGAPASPGTGAEPAPGRDAHGSGDAQPLPAARPPRTPRRPVPAGVAVVVVAVALAAGVCARRARTGPDTVARPNVLILVMDTTRADRCGTGGYDRPTTPRLDAFARDAVVFRDAWSPSNWTGPAHATLFTGQRIEKHGFHEGNRRFLASGATTLAESLREAGWATACFSNNSFVSRAFGLAQGFTHEPRPFARAGRRYPWAAETHADAADWALLRASAGEPFFLFINDMEPHLQYEPPEAQAVRFLRRTPAPGQRERLREFAFPATVTYGLGVDVLDSADLEIMSDLYDAEIATLDEEVGRLFERLDAAGVLERTLVVVVSDHGENLGDHHLFDHGLGLHRTLLHVPLVVRWPGPRGTGATGRVVDDLVRLEDVFPTVLEACGLPVPEGTDGLSLARDTGGRIAFGVQPPQTQEMARYVAAAGPADTAKLARGIESACDGRHHLLRWSDGSEQLFDVRADPGETTDLRAALPDVAGRLRALLPPAGSRIASPPRSVGEKR